MAREYTNIDKLKKAIKKKEEAYEKERKLGIEKFARIGFGANMRGYKKVSSLSDNKEYKLRDDLRELNEQLEKLERLNKNIARINYHG